MGIQKEHMCAEYTILVNREQYPACLCRKLVKGFLFAYKHSMFSLCFFPCIESMEESS